MNTTNFHKEGFEYYGQPLAASSFLQENTKTSKVIVQPYQDTSMETDNMESRFYGLVKRRIQFWEGKKRTSEEVVSNEVLQNVCKKKILMKRRVNWTESGICSDRSSVSKGFRTSRESVSSSGSSSCKSTSSGITSMSNPSSESGNEVNRAETEKLQNEVEKEEINEEICETHQHDSQDKNAIQQRDEEQERKMVEHVVSSYSELLSIEESTTNHDISVDLSPSLVRLFKKFRKNAFGSAIELVVTYLLGRTIFILMMSSFTQFYE